MNVTKREELINRLQAAAARPILDNMGKCNLDATCRSYKLSRNHALKQRLITLLDPSVVKQRVIVKAQETTNSGMTLALSGLPFGDKTIALGWEVIQHPAVYAIVCRTTGRAFISSSIHPDKQRNVHFYWMKNWFKYGTSNTFFGNKKFIDDVKDNGLHDFRMEILESYPGMNSKQVHQKAVEFLERHGLECTYNRWIHTAYGGLMCQFYDIDDEVRTKTDEFHKDKIEYESLVIEHRKLFKATIETRNKLKRELRDCKITNGEYCRFNNSLTDVIVHSRAERELAGARMDLSKIALKTLVAKKKKYYSALTEPF
jgi:hypothetical protein